MNDKLFSVLFIPFGIFLAAFQFTGIAKAGVSFSGQNVITTSANYAYAVHAADIDGDGDLDVISASAGDDTIAWYENTDGNGSFGGQQVISTAVSGPESVYAADFDGDGDIDVISGSYSDNKVAWYENTNSLGNFGSEQIISSDVGGCFSVFAANLDLDSDIDVMAAAADGNKIEWFQNELPVSADNEHYSSVSPNIELWNYPNPFNPSTTIHFELEGTASNNRSIEIFNVKGQLIKSIPINSLTDQPINSVTWNGTDQSNNSVSSGLYYCKLNVPNSPVKKMVLIR